MAVGGFPHIPYCGSPPTVATLWGRWNLDPVLIVALLAVPLVWLIAPGRQKPLIASWRSGAFLAGWFVGSVALISPLCPLSVSLFSARVGQHMMLTIVAAPLIVLRLPRLKAGLLGNPLLAAFGFTVMLWFWHAPRPYEATFSSDAVYWAMHLTTFGAALWFWRAVLRVPPERIALAIAGAVIGGVQMAFLGALITFSPRALYAAHTLTTRAWGLTPLQDQQIGGAIMWVPAGVIFVAAILGPLALALRQDRELIASGAPAPLIADPAL